MILQVISETGEVLGAKDVTGTQWTAGLDGFLNAEPIAVILDVAGVPARMRNVDHTGNQIGSGAALRSFGWVERGSIIHHGIGRWVIRIIRRKESSAELDSVDITDSGR